MTVKRTNPHNPHNPPVPPPVVALPRSATATLTLGALTLSASATVAAPASIAAQADLILGALTLEASATGGGPGIAREAALDAVLGSLVVSATATGGDVGTQAHSVEITFPGGLPTAATLSFGIAGGTDLGDYVAPTAGFTQGCVRVRHASLANFMVDFRNDASGTRSEVVFWNGECDPGGLTVASGYIRNLPRYIAVIKDAAGATLASNDVPPHFWGTRWRYQSAPRPVIRTAAQVYSDGFLPPMSSAAARIAGYSGIIVPPVPAAVGTYTTFMPPDDAPSATTTLSTGAALGATAISLTSLTGFHQLNIINITMADGTVFTTRIADADPLSNPVNINSPLPSAANSGGAVTNVSYKLGMVLFMETGGERNEIGLITEWQADYLLRGTASSLSALRNHAEMCGSEWPFFAPDVATGKLINFKSDVAHYKSYMDWLSFGANYYIAHTNVAYGWELHEQDSHIGNVFLVPYALTEDAYIAEAAQALANYSCGTRAGMYERETLYGNLTLDPTGATGLNGAFTCCSKSYETRTIGWGVRNIATAYVTTPASAPSWLLPRSYFAALSSDYSKVIDVLWTQSSDTLHAVFHQLAADIYFQSFEQAYGIMGMALADLVGLPVGASPSWFDQMTFYFDMISKMLDGTSGWDRQCPLAANLNNDGTLDPFINFNSIGSWGDLYAASQAWVQQGAYAPSAVSPGNRMMATALGNCSQVAAACACAKSRGVTDAAAALTWINTFIDFNYPDPVYVYIAFYAKCGFDGS